MADLGKQQGSKSECKLKDKKKVQYFKNSDQNC